MTETTVVGLARQAIELTLLISMPMLLAGLVVGLLISIFQAVTQIQEMTLTFVPKIVAVLLALLVAFPWIMRKMLTFTEQIILGIPGYIK
ncbi:flagellar biosynthetic protein FliQ [Thermodesulfatator indicus DSM 15286]|uniref:Flagellar biosynthetic protein FliQ n=1 Tax=Thermodesulfatator indicus (strain DSM 15286 / JCM 11887 / CIR29812) TaxID=667014 RepID=F8A9C8_THEID|nr:flagellar biosynthesis protein FliQ [Thermodesulfatator indicus]AEH44069.1 flagellar biosynthetic protein FliQ [Thermodesulfatator indicus DSM 15286]